MSPSEPAAETPPAPVITATEATHDGEPERAFPQLTASAPKRRMLIIVNPYATTVSDRLRNLVVYALQGRYEVDAVDTEAKGHAIELCREAAHEGYDVVVAFGGDGTVNEAANGLAGSDTALSCLPGGSANVYCKILGIPGELVDAAEHLLRIADDWRPRRVDLAAVNGRYFTFSAGLGLDAMVVERVDAHPRLKARYGPYFYTQVAVSVFVRRYLVHPPRLRVYVPGAEPIEGVQAIVQNAAPYTFFKDRPISVAEGATLESGTFAGAVLRRASPVDMPTIAWRAFSRRASLTRHRRVVPFAGTPEVTIATADERPLALQVDGDYVGETGEARFAVLPGALKVVS